MKRIEIMINQSIADEMREKLEITGLLDACTRWTPVFGTGHSGPREGTAVWPETNSVFLIFLEDAQLDTLRSVIRFIKKTHPKEGVKCFISAGPEEVL